MWRSITANWRLLVKAGDLVRVLRRSIGMPKDSLGLALGYYVSEGDYHVWEILINGRKNTRRYLEEDLEVVSESR